MKVISALFEMETTVNKTCYDVQDPPSSLSRARLQQVFGDKLKVEEKVHILNALVTASDQKPDFTNCCSTADHEIERNYSNKYENVVSHTSDIAPARFVCQLCDKRFSKRSDLRTHIATHLSLQGSVCEVCGRTFSHISNLIRHSRIHSGLKPYPCKMCGQCFRQASALQQHKISHHAAQPISCPALPFQCDKKFRTPVIAKRHAYREHPNILWENNVAKSTIQRKQRSFYCSQCGDEFQHRKDLKAHSLDHGNYVKLGDEMKIISASNEWKLMFEFDSGEKLEDHSCLASELKTTANGVHEGTYEGVLNTSVPYFASGPKLQDLDSLVKFSTDVMQINEDDSSYVQSFRDPSHAKTSNGNNFSIKQWQLLSGSSGHDHSPFFSSHAVGLRNLQEETGYQLESVVNYKGHEHLSIVPSVDMVNFEDISNQMNSTSSPIDHLFGNVSEIEGGEEKLSRPSDFQSSTKYMDNKDHGGACYAEDLLESGVDCSSVTYDVNMGLCPDSPSDSLDGHLLSKVQRRNEKPDILCSSKQDNSRSNDDSHEQLSQVECSVQDKFPNAEPLMLSFGDSYSALLKEIGIVEEDECVSVEAIEAAKVCLDYESTEIEEPSLSNLWCGRTAPVIEIHQENENNKSEEDKCYDRNHVPVVPPQSSPITQELPDFSQTEDNSVVNSNLVSMDYTDHLSSLLLQTDRQPEDIIIYVTQENNTLVKVQKVMTANSCGTSGELMVASTPSARALCSIKAKNKSCTKKKCLAPFPTRPVVDEKIEVLPVHAKRKQISTLDKSLIKQDSVKESAQGIQQFMHLSSGNIKQDSKPSKKKPNRTKTICTECGKVFFKRSNLMQHLGLHFPNMKLYNCHLCDQSFSWKSSLNKHLIAHAATLKQFLCDTCGRQYKSLDQVKQHKKRDHQSLRPHNCEICKKSFFRRYDLLVHERIHDNKKQFMCEICGKTFNHLSHVKRHENVHRKDKAVSVTPALIHIK